MAKAEGRQVKSLKSNIILIRNPPLWCGGRYSAWVRQMYFELYNCHLSGAMVNRVIRVIATALGITLGKLPSSRTRAQLRLEGGCRAQLCAAAAMAEVKAEAQTDGGVLTISEGRDTTTARGCHFQVHSSHVTSRSGPVHLVNDAPVVHNKTAGTQAEHTRHVRTTVVSLAQGLVQPDAEVDSKITDSAKNELAGNRLEGIRLSVPCVGHCAQNTAYHGSTPDEGKMAFVNCCYCQEWLPSGGAQGPILWIYCDLCHACSHAKCFGLEVVADEWLCHLCRRQGFDVADVVYFSSNSTCQRQYGVIKGLLDGHYGKGAVGDYWIHLAEGGWNPLILSRTVAERLFGVFFASANLLVQRQEIVRFLQLKVGRAEEEGGGWWGSLLEWVQSVECELFLSQSTVVHAAWGKPFFVETEGAPRLALRCVPLLENC